MTIQRGDVVMARVPHAAGGRGKRRPAVVIQADAYNSTLRHVILAEATSNPRWVGDPACLPIDISTPEGQATGPQQNCVISCLHIVTMYTDRLSAPVGRMSPALMQALDGCLKAALGLP